MRIDLLELAKTIDKQNLQIELHQLNDKYKFSLTLELWDNFITEMTPVSNGQIAMFAQADRLSLEQGWSNVP